MGRARIPTGRRSLLARFKALDNHWGAGIRTRGGICVTVIGSGNPHPGRYLCYCDYMI
jgi:hypothetical protein